MNGNIQVLVGKRFDTGKKWIDPANEHRAFPIYGKVIDCGALPNNTTKTVALGNDAAGNAEVVDIAKYGRIVSMWANDGTHLLLSHRDLTIDLIAASVELVTGTNLSAYTQSYVEIEFCDTTDEGS